LPGAGSIQLMTKPPSLSRRDVVASGLFGVAVLTWNLAAGLAPVPPAKRWPTRTVWPLPSGVTDCQVATNRPRAAMRPN
jgi:hypothetical protein